MNIENQFDLGANASIGYIKTLLDPKTYHFGPPSIEGGISSMSQSVSMYLNYSVVADPVKPAVGDVSANLWSTEYVAFSTGMFAWFVQNGLTYIFHGAFVGGKGVAPINVGAIANLVGSTVNGLTLINTYFGPSYEPSNPQYLDAVYLTPGFTFAWNAACWVPREGEGYEIKISPDLSENFSSALLTSGVLTVRGVTIPAGAFALTGQLSAGVIMDTRDISRAQVIGGPSKCYEVTDITKACITEKDALLNKSVLEGITTIVAVDAPSTFTSPDQNTVDVLEAEFSGYVNVTSFNNNPIVAAATDYYAGIIPQGQLTYYPPAVPPTTNSDLTRMPYECFSEWVTPWDTDFFVQYYGIAPAVKPIHYNRLATSAIGETGVLDVEVLVPWIVVQNSLDGPPQVKKMWVNAVHIFTTVVGDHVEYHPFGELKCEERSAAECRWAMGNGNYFTAAVAPPAYLPPSRFKFEPHRFRSSFTKEGKYMGTLITVSFTHQTIHVNYQAGVWVGQPQICAVARTDDKVGNVGIAHLIRYDQIGAGQTLAVDGTLNAQVVAQGSLAPFIRAGAAEQKIAADVNVKNFLRELWNGPNPIFKRNYTSLEYDAIIKADVPNLNVSSIEQIANEAPTDATTIAAQAAGIIPMYRGINGSSAGDFAPQFSATGRFGAAGMFSTENGSAAGQFGMGSRRQRF